MIYIADSQQSLLVLLSGTVPIVWALNRCENDEWGCCFFCDTELGNQRI